MSDIKYETTETTTKTVTLWAYPTTGPCRKATEADLEKAGFVPRSYLEKANNKQAALAAELEETKRFLDEETSAHDNTLSLFCEESFRVIKLKQEKAAYRLALSNVLTLIAEGHQFNIFDSIVAAAQVKLDKELP